MQGKKILIIDDDKVLRAALLDAFRTAGYTVIEADDGEKGVALALKEKPDLILLDISMPKVNGHQALQALRRDAWGRNAKVILLTSHDDPGNISKGVEQKSDDYIIKSIASLEDIIKKSKQVMLGYS